VARNRPNAPTLDARRFPCALDPSTPRGAYPWCVARAIRRRRARRRRRLAPTPQACPAQRSPDVTLRDPKDDPQGEAGPAPRRQPRPHPPLHPRPPDGPGKPPPAPRHGWPLFHVKHVQVRAWAASARPASARPASARPASACSASACSASACSASACPAFGLPCPAENAPNLPSGRRAVRRALTPRSPHSSPPRAAPCFRDGTRSHPHRPRPPLDVRFPVGRSLLAEASCPRRSTVLPADRAARNEGPASGRSLRLPQPSSARYAERNGTPWTLSPSRTQRWGHYEEPPHAPPLHTSLPDSGTPSPGTEPQRPQARPSRIVPSSPLPRTRPGTAGISSRHANGPAPPTNAPKQTKRPQHTTDTSATAKHPSLRRHFPKAPPPRVRRNTPKLPSPALHRIPPFLRAHPSPQARPRR